MVCLDRRSSATIPPPRLVVGLLPPPVTPTILPLALGVLNVTGEFQSPMAAHNSLTELISRSRRSQSPPSRGASGAPYESAGYSAGSGGATYNGSSGGYGNSSYSGGAPARSSGGTRDYPPPSRAREVEPAGSYRRS